MRRREFLRLGAVGVAGYGSAQVDTDAPDDDDCENASTKTPTPTTTSTQSAITSFEGSGSEVLEDVSLDSGLTIVEATHDGTSNFIVTLVPSEGTNTIAINAIGAYDGATAALVKQGTYMVDVAADGKWSLTIRQPRPSSGDALPQSVEGEGSTVRGPFAFDGTHTATGSHDGRSNFIVQVYPLQGTFPTIVFNKIGSVDGAETTFTHDGIGFVGVQADGSWSLRME